MQEIKMKGRIRIIITGVSVLLFSSIWGLPSENPWGNLKKIQYYNTHRQPAEVLNHLKLIDFSTLNRPDQQELAAELIKMGDQYFKKSDFQTAEAFYRKVLNLSPDYWPLYNKLEKINRERGSLFVSINHIFQQLVQVVRNFKSSFLLVNQFFNLLFYSTLFVFFLFSVVMLAKYFKLALNDFQVVEGSNFSIKRALFCTALVLWPLLLISGWMIYPFLIVGFLWLYFNENEKKSVIYMLVIIAVATVLFSFNRMLENNIQTDEFIRIRKVYEGRRFEKKDYQAFDNKLKLIQAFSYYERGDFNTAQDILNSTGEEFLHPQKFCLLGNIYFFDGDIPQSIEYYRKSLQLDDHNEVVLNNFTVALMKDNNPEVFDSYAKRYPEIKTYQNREQTIKNIEIHQWDLWNRLFNSLKEKFSLIEFSTRVVAEFLGLPIIYCILFFVFYVMGLKKIIPALGESTYCSKCSKIIKEASIHRSYKLCDECHQLFSIKDVIFLEAKVLKEKELKKKFRKKHLFFLFFSIVIPGLNNNLKENNRLLLMAGFVFYFMLGMAVIGTINFSRIFQTSPLIFNLVGVFAMVFYLLVNILSVLGDEDGI